MTARTASWLNIAYQGNPQRIPRYYQFQEMDNDSDINTALDTIADFCTQSEEQSDEPFEVAFNGDPNESELRIIKQMLARWIKLNNLRSRLWYMFRDTIKNGDAFFLRDPETQEWLWLDHFTVELVKVDESKGKVPDEYIVRGLDYNRQAMFATKQADPNSYRTQFGTATVHGARPLPGIVAPSQFTMVGAGTDPRQRMAQGPQSQEMCVIDADHVIHLSLSIGNDINWPFGSSILEPIFKTYKQKELLEDAIIIYRVQRAPERRIFYIDVGTMPPERAKRHIEAIKNDIHQRRIPNRVGGGSSILDAAYNPLCLSFDTEIPLLDGRTLTLQQIIAEYQAGKENWIYSCDPITGAIMPGNITWAGPTRKNTDVIKITLDNGKTLTCTPDHKIPVLGRGFVEARNLTPAHSLIAFNTRKKNIDRKLTNERTYTQVYDHATKKWVYVHRMVGEFFRTLEKHNEFTFIPAFAEKVKNVIHHINYDRYDNDPSNLTYMNKEDHVAFHVANKQDYWDNLTVDERSRIADKISNGLKDYYAGLSDEDRARLAEVASERNAKWIAKKRVNDPKGFAEWRTKIGCARSRYLADNPDAAQRLNARLRTVCKTIKNQAFVSTQAMLSIIAQTVNLHKSNRLETAALLQNHEEFLQEVRRANPVVPGVKSNINRDAITPPRLDKIIADFGFKNWKDFAKKAPLYNHRIVSIEPAGAMDVGTITVDGKEQWHPHHTFAISSGIFVKNSINDDYFFASSADGRGSKVETLPGGECLSLDTKIPLLDGRTLPLSTIISEFEKGEQLWAYSCNPGTGEIVPGIINWAGITRRKTQVLRLTLDNGESIVATPDHHFPVDGRGKTEAKDISVGDCLIPFYSRRTDNLEQVFDNKGKCWVDTHRMVSGYLDGSSQTVRHIDADTLNNDPANLMPESGTSANPPDEETLIDGSVCNHHVVAIEYLDEPMDTGTITIDGLQVYHGYHTFALDAGVFTYNSTGEISDLSYFSKKLSRGLRVPTSYLNIGDDQNTGVTFNDGKLGAAMIQEYRFSKYCMRLQSLLAPVFDKEFKRYLNKNGIEIESSLFELRFNPPQSFTRYRQIELDSQRVGVYQGVAENKKLSERFKLQRYLGLSEDELIENEELWAEENADRLRRKTGASPAESDAGAGLSAVGLHPEGDLGGLDDMPAADEGMEGPETAPGGPGAGAGGPMGAPAPAAPATGGGAPPM
jgi:intein/homing endonuclease